jgi:hypothetical protein
VNGKLNNDFDSFCVDFEQFATMSNFCYQSADDDSIVFGVLHEFIREVPVFDCFYQTIYRVASINYHIIFGF